MKNRNDERKKMKLTRTRKNEISEKRSNERKKLIKTEKFAIKKEKQTFFHAYNVKDHQNYPN